MTTARVATGTEREIARVTATAVGNAVDASGRDPSKSVTTTQANATASTTEQSSVDVVTTRSKGAVDDQSQ